MAKNLFVAGLDYSVTSSELEELFSQFGSVVSAKVIMDRDTDRSKGFGFVEMSSGDEAQAAISNLNQTDLKGRTLMVKEARPKTEQSGSRFGGGNKFGNDRGGGRKNNNGRSGGRDNYRRDW